MPKLVRFPEAASLGIHAAVILAGRRNGLVPARQLAEGLHASEAHLAKVMQRLVRAGIVASTRGPHGGFALARPASEVTLLEVYEAIEGTVEPATCVFGAPVCGRKSCVFRGVTEELDGRLRAYLAGATLGNLAEEATEKETANAGATDHPD
ncbi:MAG TPA: Rrf2 family transcriptional regulator [Planctomycetota bacterium]|nr:Rrf2 family transcriptional regulator [Planctomycetota bacterium]HRR81878.1 Rrf2 family transcriptional regulator [Planctomycetota bacterium]